MKSKKGFTLIELLVVIAIIGILAGIVLVSLRGAPGQAKDARIQSAVTQARTQAEMIWSADSKYDDLCAGGKLNTTDSPQLASLQADIASQQGEDSAADAVLHCHAEDNEYCISAQLVSTDDYFCVDGEGNVVDNASSTDCGATSMNCL